MSHSDFSGVPLIEGDLVAYLPPNYRHMIRGIVVGFTPKMIRIQRILPTADLERYVANGWALPLDLRDSGYVVRLGVDYEPT